MTFNLINVDNVDSMTFDAKNGRAHDSVVVNRLSSLLLEKVIDLRKHWWAEHRGDIKKEDNRKLEI